MLTGTRVLVTGATGQVARPIAERLNAEAAGNEVWAAARFTDPVAKAELEAQGIRCAAYTMGDQDLGHLPDVDYVIHCAADTAPATADLAFAGNASGTGWLMKRYADATAFFHMSSSSVYQVKPEVGAVYAEDDLLGGHSAYAPYYAMSKFASEAVVRFQSAELGLPAIMGRLNVAYGTSGHGGLPNVLFQFMKNGIPFRRVAGRESWASPIHQDDIADQVQGLLMHAQVGAPAVNLGGDEPVSLETIAAYIEELSGLSMIMEDADEAMWGCQILDATKRTELAGPCNVPWREGVRSALAELHDEIN